MIFWNGKKIHDFCSKINNSKYLQNTKKILTLWKSSKSQLSTQGMTKIWSKQKKLQRGGDFFLSLLYIWHNMIICKNEVSILGLFLFHLDQTKFVRTLEHILTWSQNRTYTVRDKKKSPPVCKFFCFDHNFVIPWVWVENLISLES